ncbi:MAG TPA: hypothetical protein VGP93_12485, partial [Polyangiaceae bacterium]|nr:hypothetical protein [Polyangiaceae bacterium]
TLADLLPVLESDGPVLHEALAKLLVMLGREGSQADALIEPLLALRARAQEQLPAATREELGLAVLALLSLGPRGGASETSEREEPRS